MRLNNEICTFLEEHGFSCSRESIGNQEFIITTLQKDSADTRAIIPVNLSARDISQARIQQNGLAEMIENLSARFETYPLIITQDRWNTQREMMQRRLLSHLEIFFPVYARNCEVRKIDKKEAADFLINNHSYADASCRYRYGLFLKRHTGHIAHSGECQEYKSGTLVAVATFSNARKWIKGDKVIRSYEWTRYASLPQIRVTGGMGKLLKAFISEVKPDDIMSYTDLEWSEGSVYEKLGFILEGIKSPVIFEIDPQMQRHPLSLPASDSRSLPVQSSNLLYINLGSRKYRLKLTEYE